MDCFCHDFCIAYCLGLLQRFPTTLAFEHYPIRSVHHLRRFHARSCLVTLQCMYWNKYDRVWTTPINLALFCIVRRCLDRCWYLHSSLSSSDNFCHANQMGFHCLRRNSLRLRHHPVHFRNNCHLHSGQSHPLDLCLVGCVTLQCLSRLRYPTYVGW